MASPRTSIWTRKMDLLYLVFFIIHVPVMLVCDLSNFYPASIRPEFTIRVREFYIARYQDRFFIDPPPFFTAFTILELVYHVPVTFWSMRALVRDDPMVPLQLLIFALETAITTLACTVETFTWDGYTQQQKNDLAALYVPYLVFAAIMGVDTFLRLKQTLLKTHALGLDKKTR